MKFLLKYFLEPVFRGDYTEKGKKEVFFISSKESTFFVDHEKTMCVLNNKVLGSDTIYPLGSAHLSSGKNAFYPLGKKHYHWGGGILSSGKNSFYPRGKKHIYPMVSDTLSSGKWHIILWEKKLIPSGNWTRGNWKITENIYIKQNLILKFKK